MEQTTQSFASKNPNLMGQISKDARSVGSLFRKAPFVSVVTIAVLVIGLVATVIVVQQETQLGGRALFGGPDIFFSPNEKSVALNARNQTYDIFMTTNGFEIAAVDIAVNFNPSHLQVTQIVAGDKLPLSFRSNVGNTTATITVASRPDQPFNGTGKIATLTFNTGSTNVSSDLNFATGTQVAAVGGRDNILGNRTKGVVVIGSGGTVPPPGGSTPTPPPGGPFAPRSDAPSCESIGVQHDARMWHGIWNEDYDCHWDHEHHDDPYFGDNAFFAADDPFGIGTTYYEWAGSDLASNYAELSYPWQTFKGAGYQNEPQLTIGSGLFENDLKHEFYKFRVDQGPNDQGEPCTQEVVALSEHHCISKFRLQFHGSGTHQSAITQIHSMFIEALGQTLNNDCAMSGSNRCYAALGGWVDFGRLRRNGYAADDPTTRVVLPGDNPLYSSIAINLKPYRQHTSTDVPEFLAQPLAANALNSWNSSGNDFIPSYGEPNSRVYYGYGFHMDDVFGPFDPNDLPGDGRADLFCGNPDAKPNYYVGCDNNSSSMGIFRAWINFPAYLDGSKYDQDTKTGFVTIHGFTNRYGDIVTYMNKQGQVAGISNCAEPGLDCVPVIAENYPVQQTAYRGAVINGTNTANDMTEYDIYFCNGQVCDPDDTSGRKNPTASGWIKFPN